MKKKRNTIINTKTNIFKGTMTQLQRTTEYITSANILAHLVMVGNTLKIDTENDV